MAKLITVNPSNISAVNKTRVQEWLFSTGVPYLTKDVDGKQVPIENAAEVTKEHIEKYLGDNLKSNVYNYERQKNLNTFETTFIHVSID